MTSSFARGATLGVSRPAVIDWLDRHADVSVRFIVAPPGFGKTTAITAYCARASGRRRVYEALDEHTTREALLGAIAEARTALAEGPVELILDDVHLADAETRAALDAFVADLPAGLSCILASQRRDVIDVGTLFARGAVALCDQGRLGLDTGDAQSLCAQARVDISPAALAALIARTDGWPPAIVGTLREMTRDTISLDAAYERWRDHGRLAAIDFVNALLERMPPAERGALRRWCHDGTALAQAELAVLHRCGFFVRFDRGSYALMRWVDELFGVERSPAGEPPPLALTLFGRFSAEIAGVPIVWARRRDQQIVKYLALRPQGWATRIELAEIFWPGIARPLALQNLRTACSTIRRALGNAVGIACVDRYFRAGERLALDRTAIVCDVDRFRQHAAQAEREDAAGALGAAIDHLRAAEALYATGLFAGDPSEPMFFAQTEELAAIYGRLLGRLSGALIEYGSPDLARAYATKAHRFRGFEQRGASGTQIHLRFAAS